MTEKGDKTQKWKEKDSKKPLDLGKKVDKNQKW